MLLTGNSRFQHQHDPFNGTGVRWETSLLVIQMYLVLDTFIL